ncbi:MAG: DNA internalization-related competence protein ComEC/Rec2 [Dehalococcoidia bacterium]|nr:DNA internalization-related competence protein ComEC/Rec2 [Dehalococcoidia bacterium]
MWLLTCSCGFIAGVALTAVYGTPWIPAAGLLMASMVVALTRHRLSLSVILALCAIAVMVGNTRYTSSLPEWGSEHISFYNDEVHDTMEGTIAEQPEQRGMFTRFVITDVIITTDQPAQPVAGRVLASTYDVGQLTLGDRVALSGVLESPPPLDGFDYAAYLACKDIYSVALYSEVRILPQPGDYPVRSYLASLNQRFSTSLSKSLPEPESSLAQSLLLGRRGSMPESVEDAFNRTGTTHLLAISGLHLGILLVALLTVLLAILGRRHYLYVWFAIAALWTYASFTGMNPPVVRAAAMASLFLLAELAGRQKNLATALAFAAAIMVAIEPALLWDTSFQLSALAMAGITVLFEPIRLALARILPTADTQGWHVRILGSAADVVAATCAATLAILPVTANTFGIVSLVAIPASLLTIPILPLAISTSAMTALVALVSPVVAQPFAWVCWLFLHCLIDIVTLLSHIPWATVSLHLEPIVVLCYYICLLCGFLFWKQYGKTVSEELPRVANRLESSRSRMRWAIPPLLIIAALVWSAVAVAPDGKLHVVFLDVGQGDAILVISPSGRTVLVDGGTHASGISTMLGQHLPFWNRTIDMVISTQPHADHIGGLLDVLDRYEVHTVVQSTTNYDSLLVEEWNRRLSYLDISPVQATAGMSVALDEGTILTLLNPPEKRVTGTSDDVDNNGVVLRIDYGTVSFLLTADIRLETERRLLHDGTPLRATVLKVGHHGSDTSSGSQFLAAVDPECAIVSVGKDNSYGHPHESVVNRLEEYSTHLYTTAESGTIELTTDGESLWMQTWKHG